MAVFPRYSASRLSRCGAAQWPPRSAFGATVSFDLRALRIYIDGSCRRNPGGAGGLAVWLEFPFDWGREDEFLYSCGYFSTTNQRMEVEACLYALEWIVTEGLTMRVYHFQIVTDSKYLSESYHRSVYWSRSGWRNTFGRPVENVDQWKAAQRLRRKIGSLARVELELIKGKSTRITKAVDRDAKAASLAPTRVDWGYRDGKIGRSKNNPGKAARIFPASGEELVIRVYGSKIVRRPEQKVKFQTRSQDSEDFVDKYLAYASSTVGAELHRHHVYRVRMNNNPGYPQIVEVIEELLPESPERSTPTAA